MKGGCVEEASATTSMCALERCHWRERKGYIGTQRWMRKKKASEPFFDSCPTDDVRSSPSRAWDKPRIVSQQYAVFLEWQAADIKRCAVGYWHHRHAVDRRPSMLDRIRSTLPFAGSECGTCRSFRLFLDQ